MSFVKGNKEIEWYDKYFSMSTSLFKSLDIVSKQELRGLCQGDFAVFYQNYPKI